MRKMERIQKLERRHLAAAADAEQRRRYDARIEALFSSLLLGFFALLGVCREVRDSQFCSLQGKFHIVV